MNAEKVQSVAAELHIYRVKNNSDAVILIISAIANTMSNWFKSFIVRSFYKNDNALYNYSLHVLGTSNSISLYS